ncbi:hypothetical protein AWRI1631_44000 [Saccharomyces cerevisiae AWRI1631]|uniref:Uncharacterized protein n=1 Tax=Saccharomyces cerevisiae (strain AWRI1631) TaxID=545124 RepID=B5VG74_YEAS6|nr:hypothetical protein AWRI1631_44000 [Saccharomyces cerevisiae AWRI1631]
MVTPVEVLVFLLEELSLKLKLPAFEVTLSSLCFASGLLTISLFFSMLMESFNPLWVDRTLCASGDNPSKKLIGT